MHFKIFLIDPKLILNFYWLRGQNSWGGAGVIN